MSYRFQDLGEIDCGEVARTIAPLLLGRRAVNVSFDSGVMHAPDWEQVGALPVTPPITEKLIANWPVSHNQYCDEWWIFEATIPPDFQVKAFCNFIGTRIDAYKDLDWPGGYPLDSYLARFQPWLVIGNNERAYSISRT